MWLNFTMLLKEMKLHFTDTCLQKTITRFLLLWNSISYQKTRRNYYSPTLYSQISENIRTVRWSDTSWYLISQVQYLPTALLTFTFPKLRPAYDLMHSTTWCSKHCYFYVHACQCSIICDPLTEYSGKLSIISVLHKVWFKHHLNDCLKERGRIGLFKLVMVSYQ